MKSVVKAALNAIGIEVRRASPKVVTDPYHLAMYRRLYPADSITNRRFYNVGAGSFSHPCWTNIDHESAWYSMYREQTRSGISYDLLSLQPIPVESDSAECVYTSHTIEHIPDAACANLFREAHRMLKPGGLFRATTPNIDLELRAYRDNDRDYFDWVDRYSRAREMARVGLKTPMRDVSTAQLLLWHFATSASEVVEDGAAERVSDAHLAHLLATLPVEAALDACTAMCPVALQKKYPGRHVNWWNFPKLDRMLRAAGFTDVRLSGYGQSASPAMRDVRRFDNTHPKVSIYVEARKS